MSARCFAAERVVLPDGLDEPGWVLVQGSRIADAGRGSAPAPVDESIPGLLLPGFVDIHAHGGGGAEFESADAEQVALAVATHRSHGTTTSFASLVSAHPDAMLSQVAALADMCDDDVIAGIHLEGPWLSPTYKGAHDVTALRDPSPEELESLLAAGRGHVKMVTFAPERAGALATIRFCVDSGVVAAVGHTNATYEEVVAAISAGATVATHLFNAMRPVKHRDPGPIPALTEDPRVTAELIADGIHLVPPAIRFAKRAASGRIVLVTDAMAAAGAAEGVYDLGGLSVTVTDGTARLTESGVIAGSTLTMDSAFRRMVLECDSSVVEASAAASTTGARLMGLDDRGRLARGAYADMCELDGDLRLVRVWRNGALIRG
ncbi:MAG: N-acetylglucosamine-6-phosphate deacetylase [Candidatus Nanopelagicales bacterium]|nr:N-acetylglucosamine-6-phosphate deacetylase [Candidatus Nanopelagicales bacterium]MDZ4250252.1 N-acetylglucosamine-6-phosphate deacetylase [Candidatus Nanopelagicales bacterium]